MKKTHYYLIAGFIALFILGYVSRGETLGTTTVTEIPIIKYPVFDEFAFSQGITNAKSKPYNLNRRLYGAVTPHHMVASHMIAGVFQELSVHPPKTVILLGPNHENKGIHSVVTVSAQWETTVGIVQPNTQLIAGLLDQGLVYEDTDTMLSDHSIATILPFLKHYLPNTKIVPLLIKATMTETEINELAHFIVQHTDADTSIVVSTDFSHYLSLALAEEKDAVMRELIAQKRVSEILRLNNDYTDSPPSLGLLLTIMNLKQVNNYKEFDHSNSGRIIPDTQGETTSYFTLGFYKDVDTQ